MHKAKRAVLHMLFPMSKLPELTATVEVPHLQLPTVAACQQAPLLGIQCHRRQAPIAVAVLEVALALPCVDVPHADCAALIATDDLQQGRAQSHQITLLKLSMTMVMRSSVQMLHAQTVHFQPGDARLRVRLRDRVMEGMLALTITLGQLQSGLPQRLGLQHMTVCRGAMWRRRPLLICSM